MSYRNNLHIAVVYDGLPLSSREVTLYGDVRCLVLSAHPMSSSLVCNKLIVSLHQCTTQPVHLL